jgi:CubicO group peptidase (beta-lactamase class C family)
MRWTFALGIIAATWAAGAELATDPRFLAAAERSRAAQGVATLVLLDGKIVFEDYPNGGSIAHATELASGTKSFSGVLALCAVEDKLLTLDEKASATLTEWRDDPARRDITIRQILTLTSGIPGGESALITGRVPSYAEAAATAAVAAPGAKFSYGPAPFQVFGEILRRKLMPRDDTVTRYLQRKILEPLGIKPERWRNAATGNPNLPSGAALTARDWAKFGEMVRLDGKGVLPEGKLAECFRGTTTNPAYGLTWWLPAAGPIGSGAGSRHVGGPWLPKDTWQAAGAGGQRLVVIPSLQLVAVRLAPVRGREGAFDDRGWLRALVEPLAKSAPAQP